MQVTALCRECLRSLAERTVRLSGGSPAMVLECFAAVDDLCTRKATPPAVANTVLRHIRDATGVADPFRQAKDEEFAAAVAAFPSVATEGPSSLKRALTLSAVGNAGDFFLAGSHDEKGVTLTAHLDKITSEIYNRGERVLILGDNVGDFVFDRPLVSFLEAMGKEVFYAVKGGPVQNDLSVSDVRRLGLAAWMKNVISTGTDEVGIRRETMKGLVMDLWSGDSLVIAKGMGNYETISEYPRGRRVLHILKVKCGAVAAHTGVPMGTHLAMIGGA